MSSTWKSFDLFHLLFHQYSWHYPIYWDGDKLLAETNPKKLRVCYALNYIIVIPGSASSAFLLVNQVLTNDETRKMSLVGVTLSVFVLIYHVFHAFTFLFVFQRDGGDLCRSFNIMRMNVRKFCLSRVSNNY